ncbi:MAG: LysR family transcriptional regulator [Rhodobacteraceae bacterium]|nr:LysR family transcriptional regulator [Paracoccaceae bacterium]
MDRLSEMEAFVSVVEQGGFTNAASKMGISKSAISKHVSGLETRLGVRLLNRTTRRVSPTELGLSYYDRAITILADARAADEMITAMQDIPKGALRISAPVDLGNNQLSRAVSAFLQKYPDVSVNMTLDDTYVELIADGFDMAIRIGQLVDSSLRARKLSETSTRFIASQQYLDLNGTPQTIDDLANHHLLHYSNLSTGNSWNIVAPSGEERHIRAVGRLTVNNGGSLLKAAESSLGIARLPLFIIEDAMTEGRVVPILENLPEQRLSIHAIYPAGKFIQPTLRAFIDFLVEYFRET